MRINIISFGGINDTKKLKLKLTNLNGKTFLSILNQNLLTIDNRIDSSQLSIIDGEERVEGYSKEYYKEYDLQYKDVDQPFCITNNNKNMNPIAIISDWTAYRNLLIVLIDKTIYRSVALDTEMLFSDIRGSVNTERYIIGIMSYLPNDESRLIMKMYSLLEKEYIEKSLIITNGTIETQDNFVSAVNKKMIEEIDKSHDYNNRRFRLSLQSFCPYCCIVTKDERYKAETVFEEYGLKKYKIVEVSKNFNNDLEEQEKVMNILQEEKCRCSLIIGIDLNFEVIKKLKLYYIFNLDDTFKVRCITQRI